MSNPIKAAQYLAKLEDARCEGRWDEVLELVRKVRKHTNDRACLTTAVETEYAVIKASQKQNADSASTATVSAADLDTGRLLPKLLEAIDAEQTYPQDRFQAQVGLGWVHWTVGEYDVVAAQLPTDQDQELLPLDQPDGVSEWTRVCALKSTYLKGYCLSRSDRTVEALDVFQGALASLPHVWSGQKGRAQLQFWAELFLTEYCMLQAQALEKGERFLEDDDSLAPFRSWAKYWEMTKTQGAPLAGGHGFRGAVPRRRVWNEYYAAISGILQQDLPYPKGLADGAKNEASARSQLQMELKKVETAYEALLLSETTFPRADEEREEVEDFVAAVMRNWNVSVGRGWHEHDLGPGGTEGVSRGMLDILYRAATKTFHSTAILRHLFTVHLSVAEFDLAFHAFDSYMEIVKKGKARVDKTGHPEPSLDSDAKMLETASQAIIALCKYGFEDAAETAYDLGVKLEEMLHKMRPPIPNTMGSIATVDEENGNGVLLHPRVPALVYALSWQAVGISQAHWSRVTFDSSVRIDLQTKAIRSLQKSLSPETGNPTDIRSLFTLSLLLAEQRELTAAIDIVKAALLSNKTSGEPNFGAGSYWRERSLIPLWHLLALLLSARQDYTMAARACEAAFEQFNDPEVLFGSQTLQGNFRSEHLNEASARNERKRPSGLVDEMDDLEKEGIMEVKMTQLALLELLEGPEVAVNASQELLVLYTRLFGPMQLKTLQIMPKPSSEAPKSSAGTLRSIRGSIFGSKSDKATSQSRRRSILGGEKSTIPSERPQTSQTVASPAAAAPTIEITQENGGSESPRSTRSTGARGQRSESMRRNSLKKRGSNAQQQRAHSSSGVPRDSTIADGEHSFTLDTTVPNGQLGWNSRNSNSSQQSFSKGRGQLRFDSSTPTGRTPTNGSHLPASDPSSSLSPLPMIKFPEGQIERQRQTILIKVWLMIASFYRRSKMYSDAKDAIDEAKKLVDCLQVEISKETSSVTPSNPGWGGRICLEELIGDVQAEMGLLAMDEGTPYISRAYFEEALMHYPDHPSAIVGLSNILLDVYSEVLLPVPAIPNINGELAIGEATNCNVKAKKLGSGKPGSPGPPPAAPLGLGSTMHPNLVSDTKRTRVPTQRAPGFPATDGLPAPYKANSLPLIDRLAARDRAYGLLSGLTKLGKGWNYSDAWFALARAHEESGQTDKAKEALWWCVELEEGMGVRDWHCIGVNGYTL
ncbi:putative filamentation protein [Rosellinia necatrix]|uniref:Putative filamentation protein n=1 Tax=Rosellinia necatrix TaxID=77044 RepID=A0A1W2TRN0_ROSNE|nr:putative filamentation protein [Rosellinia necatrix]